ncbi:triose-phosphate isomerase family protein [[Mycoplasma] gypis]|uniref:Triosephosphate isomerase n=1 Tax=[Mycoplasma] gypis TaxID=92404 RepID=A0ABZ2RQP7_9BACT|nr:triose-phosphate isomerase family protein [[Mycoplasma] gypis]MBN0919244.1 triosephosphate isomerase [[Mycoplasma] gypis]
MNKYFLIGNHKMNLTFTEEIRFMVELEYLLSKKKPQEIFYGVAPSMCNLAVKTWLTGVSKSKIKVGAQNVSMFEKGAYTGDISASQLSDLKLDFVIIGHSERRLYHDDTGEKINQRIKNALTKNLHVILCIGETKEEYEKGLTKQSLKQQLDLALAGIENRNNIIVSYEPIWAIGTGLVASNEHLEDIYSWLGNLLPNTIFMYGGSAKPENIARILDIPYISGFLVGKASLNADSFYEMLMIMDKHTKAQKNIIKK